MSRQLIESIISNNMLEANDMVEAKMAEIRERKMYEMKRMFASEAFGGLTKDEIEARKKAGYVKAADILRKPKEKQSQRLNPNAKIIKKKIAEETLDEAGLAPSTNRARLYKIGLQAIRDVERKKKKEPKSEPKEKDGYADTPAGRNRQRADKYAAEHPPGHAVANFSKRLATNLSSGQIGQDVKSIAFRNL